MKSCPTEETLSAYVDGELAADRVAEVRTHLEACKRCNRCAEEFAEVTRAAREATSDAPPAEEWGVVWQRLRKECAPEETEEPRTAWRVVARAALLAAAAAIMAGIILWPRIIDNGEGQLVFASADMVADEVEVYDDCTVMCVDYPDAGVSVTWIMTPEEMMMEEGM